MACGAIRDLGRYQNFGEELSVVYAWKGWAGKQKNSQHLWCRELRKLNMGRRRLREQGHDDNERQDSRANRADGLEVHLG